MLIRIQKWWNQAGKMAEKNQNFPDKLERYLDILFLEFTQQQIYLMTGTGLAAALCCLAGLIELSDDFKERFTGGPIVILQLYATKKAVEK